MTVEVGQQVPDVTLVSLDRKAVRLRDLLGKPTVLAFFPGAFTSVCTREMCAFRDTLARWNEMDAQVIGISVDSPYAQKAFADHNGLTFPLLSDFTRQAVRAFGIEDPHFAGGLLPGVAKRSVFVVDRHGTVVYRWVSDNPAVEPDYDAVAEAVRRAA
jgi:peroxiredoxin